MAVHIATAACKAVLLDDLPFEIDDASPTTE